MPSNFFKRFRPNDRTFKFLRAFSPVTFSMLFEESPRCSTLASCAAHHRTLARVAKHKAEGSRETRRRTQEPEDVGEEAARGNTARAGAHTLPRLPSIFWIGGSCPQSITCTRAGLSRTRPSRPGLARICTRVPAPAPRSEPAGQLPHLEGLRRVLAVLLLPFVNGGLDGSLRNGQPQQRAGAQGRAESAACTRPHRIPHSRHTLPSPAHPLLPGPRRGVELPASAPTRRPAAPRGKQNRAGTPPQRSPHAGTRAPRPADHGCSGASRAASPAAAVRASSARATESQINSRNLAAFPKFTVPHPGP